MLQSAWQDGYVAELTVTASRPVGGWTISWSSPQATQVVNAWGMSCAVGSGSISCTGKDWAGALAPGQSVRVGLQVAAGSAPTNPSLTVTGK